LLLACGAGGGETGNIEVAKGTRLNFPCIVLFIVVGAGAGAGVLSFSATVIFSTIGSVNKTLGSLIGFLAIAIWSTVRTDASGGGGALVPSMTCLALVMSAEFFTLPMTLSVSPALSV
jgi:hypothetical protein